MRKIFTLIFILNLLGLEKLEAQQIFSSGDLKITSPSRNVFLISGLPRQKTYPTPFSLSSPARVVLDFEDVSIKQNYDLPLLGHLPTGLRLGRHPSKTRLVFDFNLAQAPTPLLEKTEVGLVVSFPIPDTSSIQAVTNQERVLPALHVEPAQFKKDSFLRSDKSILLFPRELQTKTFEVFNDSEFRRQIESSVYLVKNPGQESEQLSLSRKILASPKRFSLEAGQSRAVRLFQTEAAEYDKEQVFRVRFTQKEETNSNAIVHEILVLVPILAPVGLSINNKDGQIELANYGKNSILLEQGKSCDQKAKCKKLPAIHLFPGDTELLESEDQSVIEFVQKTASGFEVLKIVTPSQLR
jgi:hypothetical protein